MPASPASAAGNPLSTQTSSIARSTPPFLLLPTRFAVALALLAFCSLQRLQAADQFFYPKDGRTAASCRFDGPIDSADVQLLRANANRGCKTLFLASPGGDLRAALSLGRIIRAAEMAVIVPEDGECASACVFLYAGGVLRGAYGPVLIHRVYLTQPSASFSETQREFAAVGREVRRYLREVNVSDTLFDRMMTIPPEEAVALTLDEMNNLGLGILDQVHSEYIENKKAARVGMSREAWLSKKQRTIDACGPITGVPVPSEEVASRRACWDRLFPEYFLPAR